MRSHCARASQLTWCGRAGTGWWAGSVPPCGPPALSPPAPPPPCRPQRGWSTGGSTAGASPGWGGGSSRGL